MLYCPACCACLRACSQTRCNLWNKTWVQSWLHKCQHTALQIEAKQYLGVYTNVFMVSTARHVCTIASLPHITDSRFNRLNTPKAWSALLSGVKGTALSYASTFGVCNYCNTCLQHCFSCRNYGQRLCRLIDQIKRLETLTFLGEWHSILCIVICIILVSHFDLMLAMYHVAYMP